MGLPLPLATCLSWVGPPSNYTSQTIPSILYLYFSVAFAMSFDGGSATWIVHDTIGTCLRTEHTALGISVSLCSF